MKRLLIAVSLFALLFPAAAFAQQDEQTGEKVQEFHFDGADIQAGKKMPLEERIQVLPHSDDNGIYRVRENFLPELLKSEQKL